MNEDKRRHHVLPFLVPEETAIRRKSEVLIKKYESGQLCLALGPPSG
jgi:hypothetical protein